jgi:uncharacterized protein YkwD
VPGEQLPIKLSMAIAKLPSTLFASGLFLTLCVPMLPADAGDSMPSEVIRAHNLYRRRVGTPPLLWSDDLAARAQQWAFKLIDTGTFAPRRDGIFGENLFEITGGSSNPFQAVGAWASESANYNHATNSCTARCGHYTQVVWQSTKLVGCGVARNATREVWVCDYAPHGNTIGESPY